MFHITQAILHGSFVAAWWFQPTPLKNDGQLVSWDQDIPFPTAWKVIKKKKHGSKAAPTRYILPSLTIINHH
jgi:hypothetical protein